MKKHIVITNEIAEISVITDFVEQIGAELELKPSLVMSLNLVLEEAISNIILYAYPQRMGELITIMVEKTDNMLIFTITDKGVVFDPTVVPEADIMLSVQERPIGGLGIYLIKKIMNEVEYQRIDGNNVFTLKKILN